VGGTPALAEHVVGNDVVVTAAMKTAWLQRSKTLP